METRNFVLIVLLFAITLLHACGGSSGGGTEVTTVASATVVFPPSKTATRESTTRVSGTTTLGADAITVDGVVANSSDGFLSWHIDLPLNPGQNFLQVKMERGGDTTHVRTLEILSASDLPDSIIDASKGVDGSLLFLAYDLDTEKIVLGRKTILNQFEILPDPGLDPNPSLPIRRVLLDVQRNRAVILQFQTLRILDLATMTYENNFNLNYVPTDIALNVTTGHVYLSVHSAVGGLNLDTRLGINVSNISFGPPIGNDKLDRICHDSFNNLIYGWDSDLEAIVRIEVDTGLRSLLPASIPITSAVVDLAVRSNEGFIDVLTKTGERFAVSLTDFTVTSVPLPVVATEINTSSSSLQFGASYIGLEDFGFSSAFVVRSDRIMRAYLDGSFEDLLHIGRGESPVLELRAMKELAWDSQRKRLVTSNFDKLLALDPATGDLSTLPGPAAGHARFERPIRYDASRDLLYYIAASGVPATGAVYTMPATGGEESVAVPLPLGTAAQDMSYDPQTGEYLTAIQFPSNNQLRLTLLRSSATGVTISEMVKNDDPMLLASLFLVDAPTNSFVGRSPGRGEFFKLVAPLLQPQTVTQIGSLNAISTEAHFDADRQEYVFLEDYRLRVFDIATSQTRETVLFPGTYEVGQSSSLTRDPETGLIYVSFTHLHAVMVVEPESLSSAYVHY